ncbi:cytoplasmic dynein 2 heavy chain 1 [Coccinella septempunctata]|uniref:cytoplasmic dynein 2 heavy chain 1 n=1 Tax=Coccinella septempunctata TaxID=41139 RepID=UPI001D0714EA|nr:cytoplasmic dynein 2 heavy chain 1 [Coccinella septempunctata]
MNDPRISFFINISGCYLGTNFLEENWEKDVIGQSLLLDFFENININVVYSLVEEKDISKKLKFCIDLSSEKAEKFVTFIKIIPTIITSENVRDIVQITSVVGSPTLALYNTLTNVFFPILEEDDTGLLKKQILTLQADLRSALISSEVNSSDFLNRADENSLLVVRSLEHEVEFWSNAVKFSKGGINKSTSNAFKDILEPFAKDFRLIDTLTPYEVEEVLELGHNVLDDLWRHKPHYHKDRMKNLMDIVGNGVYAYSVKNLKKIDVLSEEYASVSDLLTQHISLGEKWLSSCNNLTHIFWSNYADHMWDEPPYEVADLKNFVHRLKEILSIRTVHKQLIRLLTSQEQRNVDAETIFSPLRDLNLYSCGPHNELEWIKSKKDFEQMLQPAEQLVGNKLKKQLSSINANTRQLLYEFGRYSELISRPSLKQTLLAERQYLLTSLHDYVRQLQTQTSADMNYLSYTETPMIVKELMMTRQLESRAKEVLTTSERLLNDLQEYENLHSTVVELMRELKKQHMELFDSWTSEITRRINDNTLSLRESDPVIQFSKDKLMKVNYSPRLVLLINEVRQLKALGYNVPGNICDTAEHAKKFMHLAKVLEQIASFHNTIGDRMIASQRPMMLKGAMDLWKLVEEQEVVSWGETRSIEHYVETLKKVVEDLSSQNNLLTSYHCQIMEKINQLAEVDLITKYSKWKDTVKEMKKIILQVEEKGFQNMHTWIADISKQLAKVLEKQYILSLDKLHLYLPEIHADLVYRNSELHFSPSEEELKSKYEQQMQKFLDIPKGFYAMFEFGTNVFHEIVERNKTQLDKTTYHMVGLFNQLQEVIKYWQSWLQIGELDVSKLTMWQHWDLHFKLSKTFGQEIAKLPSTEEKVGCFVVGLSRLRSDLESHNRSYWDQLASSLKNSIAQDVVALQNFIDPATATLTKQSVTLEEIAESGAMHIHILKQVPEMDKTYTEMIMKSKVLSSWTREQVDSVNRLKGAWERLQSLLENHQHIVAKQMETIKTTLHIESENMDREMERFYAKWEQAKPKALSGDLADKNTEELFNQLQVMKEKRDQWEEIVQSKNKLISEYERYSLSPKEFPMEEEIEKDIREVFETWSLFEEFYQGLSSFYAEEWIVFRRKMYRFEEFLQEWQGKLAGMEQQDVVVKIVQEITKFGETYPVLKFVRGDDFTEKHWMDVFGILGMAPKSIEELTLKDFLEVADRIKDKSGELQVISKKAASEIVVRQALAELDSWEVQSKFILTTQVDSLGNSITVIKDFKELLNKIGDHQSLLQSVKNSADYDSFSERAGLWETKLVDLDFYLTSLVHIQRKWLYLEPIFGSGTLDSERSRFEKANKDIRYLYNYIGKDPRVSSLFRFPNLRSLLENLRDQFSRCQQSLDNFLADKRNKFPRFFFLGDDDLLEIVGQSNKEQVIQTHLKKIFSGINGIRLNESGDNIVAMCSLEGEVVPLTNSVNITKPVEEWLNELVREMHLTIKNLLVQCLEDGQAMDPSKYPSQVLCLANSINFTLQCEQAIASMTLPPLLAKYKTRLSQYNSLALDFDKDENDKTDKESHVLELKLKALILDTIHHISIVEELLDVNTTKITEWSWQKQLRFYSNSLGEITVKMANARMEYAYEYLGNATQLVRTPLTEQCFITLTQGLHLGMGGNPYGPAGTGKTESVKALGALLGRQVLVFNCDEGIDAASMARILSGLVRCGAWGCFDEFNRLDEATLSAISTYIQSIQVALKSNNAKLRLLDQDIKLNKHCGIFVTLNPAGGGYGGRNKLPDNLKQLFRPVVMTHPNHELIAKSLLFCEGYQSADLIGKKLIEVFSLASKLLSKQQHYDWGLRAIKTVLTGCGRTKKSFVRNSKNTNIDTAVEISLAVNVLRADTLSKLTFSDSWKFENIIQQVFREVDIQNIVDERLVRALEESFVELGLVPNERQLKKCVELYGQLKQRMGVAIVGPPSSGKSTIRNLLRKALLKMGENVNQNVFNPKSITKNQLLGQVDSNTRQWNDGILTKYSLQVTSESPDVWSWIVCDGDVDPEWVESLNSVLDDNRLLTLPSGWRIQFGPNVNFFFETHNLDQASPATISRIGIVLLSEQDLNVDDYVRNFVDSQSEDFKMAIGPLIDEYFMKCVNWIGEKGETSIPCSKLAIVKIGLSQLEPVRNKQAFIVAIVNGLGQLLQRDFRELYAQQVFDWLNETPPPFVTRCRYNQERDMIDAYVTNTNLVVDDDFGSLPLAETGQICQSLDVLRLWIESQGSHTLLIGPHGSAKTLMIKKLVENIDAELIDIHCSTTVQPSYVINKISEHCLSVNTNKGKVFRPKKGRLILHFRNMHLLKPDKWGTNILIEFLYQLITYRAFFDANLESITLENTTIIGSLSANNLLSSRFTSIVNIYNIDSPEHEDLSIIVTSYLSSLLKKAFQNDHAWPKIKVAKLAGVLQSTYDEIRETFTNVQQKHYSFDTHDLKRWCSSILRYRMEQNEDTDENFIVRIFYYEAIKLFGEKLVNENSFNKFREILNVNFRKAYDFSSILKNFNQHVHVPLPQFSKSRSKSLSILSVDEWTSIVEKGRIQFERDGGHSMDVIMTKDLLYLLSSVNKVLTSADGHLMLIGRSGLGRRTSVKIASALYSAKLIVPNCGKAYQSGSDLKYAVQQAGVEGEDVYLLLDDNTLNEKETLSAMDTLISSGEVPGLFNTTELNSLVLALGDERSRENFEGSLIQFFAKRVKEHIHVIACVDAENEKLQEIFENCPSFIYNSTIIWKEQLSQESLEILPKMIIDKSNSKDKSHEIKATEKFTDIFEMVDTRVKNPRKYIQLIQIYMELYKQNISVIATKQKKLKAGVAKLTEAKDLVSELKQKAHVQEERLAEKQKKANAALDMISSTMQNANVHKEKMETLKMRTEEENQQLLRRKKEIELELAEVEPLIQEARAAVGKIKTESLSEIRSLRAPPEVIRDILEGVLRLMGIQDTSWNSMKNFLSKRGVKEDIRSFDAGRINPENRQAVERLMSTRSDSFNPASAKRASVAAAPLAAWVAANVKYSHVVEKIKPLEKEQYKLKQNLSSAEAQLGELNADLSDVDDTVAKLKAQLSAYTKEAAEIEIDLNRARETLSKAEAMVDKLNDEFKRWQEQLKDLLIEIQKLPICCLLSSAVITYLTSKSENERRILLDKFMEVLGEDKYDFEQFMSTKRELMQWQAEGLPNDKLSIQNAIMITKSNIIPLLIDPTTNATSWTKKHLKDRQIECVTQDVQNFASALELSVRFGKVLLVEEVNNISPLLLIVCRKQFIYQGERRLISLNGKLVDYHPDFKLILSSRDENLQVPSHCTAYISVMNFSLTHAGLTEQLISSTIRQENPQLEESKKELVRRTEELQEQQYQLQERLLEDMANSTGDILQNTKLIESLNETKASYTAVSKSIAEQEEIEKKLGEEYDTYRILSSFGSASFFAVNDFSNYNVLYTMSASAYTRIFLKTVASFQSMLENVEMRKSHLINATYSFAARGMFKEDRIKFGLHLMQKMFPEKLSQNEWRVFLQHESRTNQQNVPDWIPSNLSYGVQNLQNGLPDLYATLRLDESNLWKDFMIVESCETRLPNHCKLTDFQKVLVVQALRPDRLYSAISNFLSHFTDNFVLDFHQIYKESLCLEPILLLTTSGNDPSNEIRDLATSLEKQDYKEIAMGEGQEEEAISALKTAIKTGGWLVLKNLHLVTSWLPILSQNLQTHHHENFRLWLITEPNDRFDHVLAQNSLKVVYEVPKGLKYNIQRTYHSWGAKYVEKLPSNSAKIFFVVVCLHAILQERRTYIPQGWSKWYEFSDVDFSTCVKLLEDIWQSNTIQVPWNIIRGICSSAVYGGRIENIDDMAILESYLRQYCNDEVLSHRWRPFGMKNSLPSSSDFDDYLKLIGEIPSKISPSFYGLPNNIDRSWQIQKSSEIISDCKKLKISKSINSKFDLDLWCKGLGPFLSLWKKLNQGHDFVKTQVSDSGSSDGASPIAMFLEEEFRFMIRLIQKIHKSFSGLNRICKKVSLPEDAAIETGNYLLNYKTPKVWQSIWEGPLEPTKYLRSIFAKAVAFSGWSKQNLNELLQKPISLSSLFHPEAFLASHKLEFSSKHNVPLDQLTLESYWRPGTANSLILANLLLESAVFDGNTLRMGDSDTDNITKVPNCYITWKDKSISVDQNGSIGIPLYFTSSRNKKLTTLRVPCDLKEKDKWIQAGVAFFLEV